MCTRSVESKCAALLAVLAVFGMPDCAGAQGYPATFDFGVPASAEDIAKVAIAIRPDGEGLPAGKGDYATGKKVYETSCTERPVPSSVLPTVKAVAAKQSAGFLKSARSDQAPVRDEGEVCAGDEGMARSRTRA